MRLVPILTLALVTLTVPVMTGHRAEAGEVRVNAGTTSPLPPPARTPSVLRGGDPGLERFDGRDRDRDGHRPGHQRPVIIVPQAVYLAPYRCWQPGYWTYQFVPQSYAYNTWVDGQWSSDGQWIAGHYAPSYYNTGYYQPFWVAGYYSSC
jgi:hypothetical protein